MAIQSPRLLPDLEYEAMTAEELISWAHGFFWPRLRLTRSWQKQSSVLGHLVAELGLRMDTVELDTHLLVRESHETCEALVDRYQLKLIQPETPPSPSSTAARGRTCGSAIPTAAATSARSSRSCAPSSRTTRGSPTSAATSRRAARARPGSSGRSVTACSRSTRSQTGTRSVCGRTSRGSRSPTTRSTMRGTVPSAAFPARARRDPTRRSAPAVGAGSDKLECGLHTDTQLERTA